MFGSLGVPELIFIFALALLIFGPRKLPEIGRTIGRGLSEFRKASTDLRRSLNTEMIEDELRQSDPRKILREEDSASVPSKGPGVSDPAPPAAVVESKDAPPVEDAPPAEGAPPAAVAESEGAPPEDGAPPQGSVPRSAGGDSP